ncbi:hypothetical protein [Limnovirga soli]|uniref:Uncharacterized protein n=1 Tax=Limnovirga soli TaxID=2656915 RepID=A0A8J8JWS2_9BACT|nr:hypothetical protein [Limnovirga soli]NNV58024.1 hypothetical protein [Limnovirga soli]
MKKRSSLDKAQWTNTREEQYRKACDEILFVINSELIIKTDKVYLKTENHEIFLLKIDKSKSMWYELWLILKYKN